jgi:hypothetical protein
MTYQKAEQQCYEREKIVGYNLHCDSFHYADLIIFFLLGWLLSRVIPILRDYFFHTQHYILCRIVFFI